MYKGINIKSTFIVFFVILSSVLMFL